MASAPRLAMTKYWLKLVKFLLPKRVFPSTHMDMTNLFRLSFWPSVSICPVRTCGSHWWCIVARCATPHVSRPALEPFFTHSTLKVGGAVLLWSEWPMARRLSQPCTSPVFPDQHCTMLLCRQTWWSGNQWILLGSGHGWWGFFVSANRRKGLYTWYISGIYCQLGGYILSSPTFIPEHSFELGDTSYKWDEITSIR